ncbi:DUF4062 domain-containing protein [Cellulosimicrobium sp. 4261]|uniref:DUF4062 domain-containing protein n=1 Tax=Cellulosimicrobium sp. 4261 TaxID=3156458 RepID=UPI00339969DD
MTSDKRYQVFVSSTYRDLTEERQAVVTTLLEVDAFPAGMELFPATDDDAWTLIESVINDSDYYLLVIGGKYGSVDATLDISYTEREYDTAVKLGKPIMAFLHGEPGTLTFNASEIDPDRRAKLEAFRKKVQASRHVKYWTSPEDLAGKVARTWHSFTKRYPATGWIRADQASSRESLEELTKANREIERLRSLLERTRTEAPAGTQGLAQGEETVDLSMHLFGQWWPKGSPQRRRLTVATDEPYTWNQLFGILGLAMIDEASVDKLQRSLADFILDTRPDLPLAWRKTARSHGENQLPEGRTTSVLFGGVEFADDTFLSLLLQFEALGMIQRSDRKRAVSDTASYWTLTDFGRTRLRQLRALPSGKGLPPGSAADAEEIVTAEPVSGDDPQIEDSVS